MLCYRCLFLNWRYWYSKGSVKSSLCLGLRICDISADTSGRNWNTKQVIFMKRCHKELVSEEMTLRSPDPCNLLGPLKQILPTFAEWLNRFSCYMYAGILGMCRVVRVRGVCHAFCFHFQSIPIHSPTGWSMRFEDQIPSLTERDARVAISSWKWQRAVFGKLVSCFPLWHRSLLIGRVLLFFTTIHIAPFQIQSVTQ